MKLVGKFLSAPRAGVLFLFWLNMNQNTLRWWVLLQLVYPGTHNVKVKSSAD